MIRGWFYREFKQYVASKGYKLLRDDFKFLERVLSPYPEAKQRELARQYLKEWELGMGSPGNQCSGRFRANQFLLNHSS